MSCSSEKDKKEWLDRFRDHNPVSQALLQYTYDQIPSQYGKLCADYESFALFLKNLQQEFQKLRSEEKEKTKQLIRTIQDQRTAALVPFELAHVYWTEQARSHRDTELAKVSKNDNDRFRKIQEIENEYRAATLKYTLFYETAILPVNLYFDGKVKEAKTQLETNLATIDKHEHSAAAPHFNYGWGLLKYAQQVKQNNYAYTQQTFTPTFVLDIPPLPTPQTMTVNYFINQAQQPPQGIDASQYADYLRFVQQRAAGSR